MKKGNFLKNRKNVLGVLCLIALFGTTSLMFAAGTGSTAVTTAANSIKGYWPAITTLSKAIGGVVGVIGGIRIYNKWSNGDQDINKELLGWGGSCLFLILAPTFISAFFN
ncbi:DUF4134 domain-containing protein [Chryseobacterium sp. CT-SW4]|uniref:DUF4134 domain-containing protein n=1 Tax=Chryseobacterium sp. SW-1 TaxID=3157343 RepID=UPI003B016071